MYFMKKFILKRRMVMLKSTSVKRNLDTEHNIYIKFIMLKHLCVFGVNPVRETIFKTSFTAIL